MEVVFQGKSATQYLDERIEELQVEIAEKQTLISQVSDSNDKSFLKVQLSSLESELDLKQSLLPYAQQYLPDTAFATLVLVVCLMIGGTVLKDLILMSNIILTQRFTQLSVFNLRKQFYRRTLKMSVGSFNADRSTELMSRFTNDTEVVTQGIFQLLGKAVREPLKMTTCLVAAAFISWRLLLLCMIVTPFAAILIGYLSKALRRSNRKAMQEMASMYGLIGETFKGIVAVKAFNMEGYERKRFHHSAKNYYLKAMKIAKYNSMTRPTTEIMGMTIVGLAILAGGYLVLNQETHLLGIQICVNPMSFGDMMTFFAFLIGASDPLRKIADVFNVVQRGAAAADRIYEMLDRNPDLPETRHPSPMPDSIQTIEFSSVDFGYTPECNVINNLSLTITQGQTVALVGPNGCGKSTLARMIPRFFDPTKGSVSVNNTDIKLVRKRELRNRIAMVTQNAIMFDDSVLNNLKYGKRDATLEQVQAAAKKAKAHQFIESKLEHGYDTIIGEGGGKLSGGQRQRLALARAILTDPEIIILDEATSQVDLESEKVIYQVLTEFLADRTAIMITHRMASLQLADRIIVMDQGKIIDDGTHDELIQRNTVYQRMAATELRDIA
ncbi:MAG: ABC transporter ATP-binding protein [Planctomycetota bacterium]|nr:ABC transporter ATP-binding protein [Planctomycetota bacterium]